MPFFPVSMGPKLNQYILMSTQSLSVFPFFEQPFSVLTFSIIEKKTKEKGLEREREREKEEKERKRTQPREVTLVLITIITTVSLNTLLCGIVFSCLLYVFMT